MRVSSILLQFLLVFVFFLPINAQIQPSISYAQNNTRNMHSLARSTSHHIDRRSAAFRQQHEQANFPSSSTIPVSSKDPIFALVIFVALSSLMF